MTTVTRQNNPPSFRLPPLVKYVLSAMIVFFGLAGATLMIVFAKKPEDSDDTDKLIPLVATFQAQDFDGQLKMNVSGRVVPYREVRIPTQVSGTVVKKSECFQAGNYVGPDDTLLVIDDTDYKIAKSRLEAELAQSKAMLLEMEEDLAGVERNISIAKQELELAEDERERKLRLSNSISKTELQNAERAYLNAKKTLQTFENSKSKLETSRERLNNGLKLVEANLEKANLDIARCVIKPPAEGVIVSESIEEGEIVQAGTVIAVFEDTSRVEVECNLRLDQMNWLLEHQGVQVQNASAAYSLPPTDVDIISTLGDEKVVWQGVLNRINGIGLDPITKTVPCRIDVINPIAETQFGARPLVRNMYVKVKIKIDPKASKDDRKFVTFPAVAIQPGNFIWLVKNGKLSKCDVTIVDQQLKASADGTPAMVVVLANDNVKEGDRVVTSPLAQPINGAQVRENTNS